MGKGKGNFIKEFIMSFLWSVENSSEKSRKREISPDNSDTEIEIEKKTPKVEKKGLKRPIETENTDNSDDEIKRSKNSSIRNEIASSLSSSVQKKKRSADFDSDNSDDEVDSAPKKVLKAETEVDSGKSTVEEENSVKLTTVESSPKIASTKLKFSRQLSPQKIVQSLSREKEEEEKSMSKSETVSNLDEENKLLVKKNVITDAKALLADQEKSGERGKKLLEAFDD